MNRRDAYEMLSQAAAGGCDFRVSSATAQELAVIIWDAARSAGESWVNQQNAQAASVPSLVDLQFLARARGCHVLPHEEWDDLQTRIGMVSEGAQRDAADLHRRVTVIEKRLAPPDSDGSWALLTTPEATIAIERLETSLAELRAEMGKAHERVRAVEIELRGVRVGIAQLQAQWQNIRNRLKALLSSES